MPSGLDIISTALTRKKGSLTCASPFAIHRGGVVGQLFPPATIWGVFETSARHMENFLPNLHGRRRSAGRVCASSRNWTALPCFCPLPSIRGGSEFRADSSEERLRVSDGTRLLDADVATPYRAEDLYAISHRQVGDVVYLAHKKYPLGKIIRSGSPGAYVWSYQTVVLNSSLAAPGAPAAAFVRGNADDTAELGFTLRYKVVAVDRKGMELPALPGGGGRGKHPSDWVVGNHVDINWPAVEGRNSTTSIGRKRAITASSAWLRPEISRGGRYPACRRERRSEILCISAEPSGGKSLKATETRRRTTPMSPVTLLSVPPPDKMLSRWTANFLSGARKQRQQ